MRILAAVPLLLAAGCMGPHPPPPPPPPELAGAGLSLDPAQVDRFLGTYASAGETLTVRREGPRILAQRQSEPAYALTRTSDRAFVDARGIAYIFMPPADGRGGMLQMVYADGQVRLWSRTS
jgi:hypothetical protein